MKHIIDTFVENKTLAIIGVSPNPRKWGNMLFKALKKKGYTVYPVHATAKEIEGVKCIATVKDLPGEVKNVILTVPADVTERVVRECKEAGIERVWMHKGAGGKGAQSKEAIAFCHENGIEVVHDFCPLMFFPPVGIHKVHLWFKKAFGKFPEDFN
jgi:hypothetical protein